MVDSKTAQPHGLRRMAFVNLFIDASGSQARPYATKYELTFHAIASIVLATGVPIVWRHGDGDDGQGQFPIARKNG